MERDVSISRCLLIHGREGCIWLAVVEGKGAELGWEGEGEARQATH